MCVFLYPLWVEHKIYKFEENLLFFKTLTYIFLQDLHSARSVKNKEKLPKEVVCYAICFRNKNLKLVLQNAVII